MLMRPLVKPRVRRARRQRHSSLADGLHRLDGRRGRLHRALTPDELKPPAALRRLDPCPLHAPFSLTPTPGAGRKGPTAGTAREENRTERPGPFSRAGSTTRTLDAPSLRSVGQSGAWRSGMSAPGNALELTWANRPLLIVPEHPDVATVRCDHDGAICCRAPARLLEESTSQAAVVECPSDRTRARARAFQRPIRPVRYAGCIEACEHR